MSDIVTLARAWIGTPYVHQASAKGAGTDCLGLLRGIWREVFGAEPAPVPPYSADWSEASGHEALMAAADYWLQRKALGQGSGQGVASGDVLLFRMRPGAVAKHLGIAGQTGQNPSFIHAYSGHGVVESPLSAPWAHKIVARYQFPSGV